jgi:hypothetical protein
MRLILFALLGVLGLLAPATAQDDVAREIERKARAGEQDDGFCARSSTNLVRLTRAQAAEVLNRLLARPDQARARLVFIMADLPSGAPACAYLHFDPVTTRDGKKCRPAQTYVCITGQDCRAKLDDAICEVRPGTWD